MSKAYFEDVANGKQPAVKLSADEYEKGINEFNEGMEKALAFFKSLQKD